MRAFLLACSLACAAINFNASATMYATPSYYNQVLFSTATRPGSRLLQYRVDSDNASLPVGQPLIYTTFQPGTPLLNRAANMSVSTHVSPTGEVVVFAVNFATVPRTLHLQVQQAPRLPTATAWSFLTSAGADDMNSMDNPTAITIQSGPLGPPSNSVTVTVNAFSVNLFKFTY